MTKPIPPPARPGGRADEPGDLPFLQEQAQIILALANESSRSIPINNDDDFGFMAMQFLYKQIQHGKSILSLSLGEMLGCSREP